MNYRMKKLACMVLLGCASVYGAAEKDALSDFGCVRGVRAGRFIWAWASEGICCVTLNRITFDVEVQEGPELVVSHLKKVALMVAKCFSEFGTELDEVSQRSLARGARTVEPLKQKEHELYSFANTSNWWDWQTEFDFPVKGVCNIVDENNYYPRDITVGPGEMIRTKYHESDRSHDFNPKRTRAYESLAQQLLKERDDFNVSPDYVSVAALVVEFEEQKRERWEKKEENALIKNELQKQPCNYDSCPYSKLGYGKKPTRESVARATKAETASSGVPAPSIASVPSVSSAGPIGSAASARRSIYEDPRLIGVATQKYQDWRVNPYGWLIGLAEQTGDVEKVVAAWRKTSEGRRGYRLPCDLPDGF